MVGVLDGLIERRVGALELDLGRGLGDGGEHRVGAALAGRACDRGDGVIAVRQRREGHDVVATALRCGLLVGGRDRMPLGVVRRGFREGIETGSIVAQGLDVGHRRTVELITGLAGKTVETLEEPSPGGVDLVGDVLAVRAHGRVHHLIGADLLAVKARVRAFDGERTGCRGECGSGDGGRENHQRHRDRQHHAGDAFCHRFHRIIPSLKRMT